jgi:predicted RNase H-like nuclease
MAAGRLKLPQARSSTPRLFDAEPCLLPSKGMAELLSVERDTLRYLTLKTYQDTLDSLLCAYVAYYFWYWGFDRNEVFGDIESGYILNPKLILGGIAQAA